MGEGDEKEKLFNSFPKVLWQSRRSRVYGQALQSLLMRAFYLRKAVKPGGTWLLLLNENFQLV